MELTQATNTTDSPKPMAPPAALDSPASRTLADGMSTDAPEATGEILSVWATSAMDDVSAGPGKATWGAAPGGLLPVRVAAAGGERVSFQVGVKLFGGSAPSSFSVEFDMPEVTWGGLGLAGVRAILAPSRELQAGRREEDAERGLRGKGGRRMVGGESGRGEQFGRRRKHQVERGNHGGGGGEPARDFRRANRELETAEISACQCKGGSAPSTSLDLPAATCFSSVILPFLPASG